MRRGFRTPYERGVAMKKYALISIFILVALFSFVACNNDMNESGHFSISINSGISKGLESISMDTVEYHIVICKETSGDVAMESTIPSSSTQCKGSLPFGIYTVSIDALNADGVVIGSGSSNLSVGTGSSTVVVNIVEKSGNGTFKVSIVGNEGYNLEVKLLDSNDNKVESLSLTYSDGRYASEVEVPNGFYKFVVTRTDTNKVLRMDSLRIVAGQTTLFEAEYVLGSNFLFDVSNDIVSTPRISLSLDKSILTKDESLVAKAVVESLSDFNCYWVVDGIEQGSAGPYSDLNLDMVDFGYGEHEVSLFIVKGALIWSESTTFELLDRNLSLDVEGDVEFWVVGDVLIPSDLEVVLLCDGVESLSFDSSSLHSVKSFAEKTSVSCGLTGADGFVYYLEAHGSESDRTIVYIVVDRLIPNCGYIDFVFNQRFRIGDRASMAACFEIADAQVESSKFGLVNLVNGESHRIVKVVPGTYTLYSADGHDIPYYNLDYSQPSVVVGEGETVQKTISNQPYATVRFVFPPDVAGRRFSGLAINQDDSFMPSIRLDDGFTTDIGVGSWEFELSDLDNPYEFRYVASAVLVDGENEVELTEKSVEYYDSGLAIDTSEYTVSIDTNGFAFPDRMTVYCRIEGEGDKSYLTIYAFKPSGVVGNSISGGKLSFSIVNGDRFTFEASSVVENSVANVTLKLVPKNGEFATGKLTYNFEFNEEYYGKCPSLSLDGVPYLIVLNETPTEVKLIPGTYCNAGGYLRGDGENNGKWVLVEEPRIVAAAGEDVSINLVNR